MSWSSWSSLNIRTHLKESIRELKEEMGKFLVDRYEEDKMRDRDREEEGSR
ncbi:MAG: hypothetical protein R6U96_02610 [Promethearchaeia archaeon]